jgi:hypothetical protein
MNTDKAFNPALSMAGYVPYVYASGRAFVYSFLPGKYNRRVPDTSPSRYDFTSDLIGPKQTIRHETVEDIVARGYFSVPGAEPELALISDKHQTSRLGLTDVIQQVRQRYEIYQRNLYDLDTCACNAYNAMMSMIAHRGGTWLSSRELYGLSKRLFEVDLQKQQERVGLWSDISKLKQLLPEQAQNYLSAYRKMSILTDSEGDNL